MSSSLVPGWNKKRLFQPSGAHLTYPGLLLWPALYSEWLVCSQWLRMPEPSSAALSSSPWADQSCTPEIRSYGNSNLGPGKVSLDWEALEGKGSCQPDPWFPSFPKPAQSPALKNKWMRKYKTDFLGGPVLETPRFHFRGHRFDPWLGKFHMLWGVAKEKNKNKKVKILKNKIQASFCVLDTLLIISLVNIMPFEGWNHRGLQDWLMRKLKDQFKEPEYW